jgi:trans-2,3-dihydro-3-hydroxyanthranilate isomerase
MPMAGHPTIGTAFALAHAGTLAPGRTLVTFGLGVGPVPVELRWDAGRLAFAWMTQLPPTFGEPAVEIPLLAGALNVEPQEILETRLPVRVVSCGVPFLMVPLVTRDAVDRAAFDRAIAGRFFHAVPMGELPVFLFSAERGQDDATVYSRMFAPGLGVAEDAATGAASGPLGSYLVHHRVVPPERAGRIISLQGVKIRRPSRIHIAIDLAGTTITRVRVGGEAVVVGSGQLEVVGIGGAF